MNDDEIIGLVFSQFIKVPIAFLQNLKPREAVVLSILMDMYFAPQSVEYQLENDGWFFYTREKLEEAGLSKDQQQRAISALKTAGFLEVKMRCMPPKRHIRINRNAVAEVLRSARKCADRSTPIRADLKNTRPKLTRTTSPPAKGRHGGVTDKSKGFGMVPPKEQGEPVDVANATTLKEIVVRHLERGGTSHPLAQRARRGKIAQWATHFRTLRCHDNVSPERITAALKWYGENIGGDYVPQAHAGESFRKKFFQIESQAQRDISTVEVGDVAARIAARLGARGWPKGSVAAVPAACQRCLVAYEAWVAARNEFIEKLRRDDLAEDIGGLRVRLLRLGEHLTRTMPPPTHFVQEWMEAVNDRIQNWDGWSGDFNGLLFKPSSSKFDKMGQEWARAFANDPDRWTKFCEVMEREGN